MLVVLVDFPAVSMFRSVKSEVNPSIGGAPADASFTIIGEGSVELVWVDALYVNMLNLCRFVVVFTVVLLVIVDSVLVAGNIFGVGLVASVQPFLRG